MTAEEGLLRDLSLLLELTLVPGEQDSVEDFVEDFVDRLLAKTYAVNALFFVRATLNPKRASNDDSGETSLFGLPVSPENHDEKKSFVAVPRRRAQYLVRAGRMDGQALGLERILSDGRPRLVSGHESCLSRVAFSGVDLPDRALQLPMGDVGMLEVYAGRDGVLDEHLGRVLSSLSDWLASQLRGYSAQSTHRSRLSSIEDSERSFETFINALPGVMWRADIHGRLTYLSEQAGPMLGLTDVRTWTRFRKGIHASDAHRVDHELAEAIATGQKQVSLSYRYVRGPDDVIRVRETIGLGFQAGGGLVSRAGFIYLATPDGSIQEVEPAPELVGQRLRSSTFMDKLSHELRSPLFPVIALSDLLLQRSLDDESREHLALINESGKELLHLVSDLLDISRIDVGRTRIDPGRIGLSHFARLLESRHGSRATQLGRSLTIRLAPGDHPDTVHSDRAGLERAANALIELALEIGDEGGMINLDVEVKQKQISVRVTFPCAEITAEEVDGLFEPFQPPRADKRDRPVGLGLSLTVVRDLSAALGGTSRGERRRGDVIVEVGIPVAYDPGSERALAGRNVLIVGTEMSEIFPTLLGALALGAEARVARTIEDAERQLDAREFDSVIIGTSLFGRRRLRALLDAWLDDADAPEIVGLFSGASPPKTHRLVQRWLPVEHSLRDLRLALSPTRDD